MESKNRQSNADEGKCQQITNGCPLKQHAILLINDRVIENRMKTVEDFMEIDHHWCHLWIGSITFIDAWYIGQKRGRIDDKRESGNSQDGRRHRCKQYVFEIGRAHV